MAITKTLIGTNPDGSNKYDYLYEGHPDGGLMFTGKVAGTVMLSDGTAYNVTPDVIETAPGHAGGILHHIEKMHEASGDIPGFVHSCSDTCGPEADKPKPDSDTPNLPTA
jgi:hypothetical protein